MARNEVGEHLADKQLAVGTGHVAGRMLNDAPFASGGGRGLVLVELDDALDRPGCGIHDGDVAALGLAPITHEDTALMDEEVVRLVAVGKCVDRRNVGFVRFVEDKRNSVEVQVCGLSERFERVLEQDVGVLGRNACAGLKPVFAEDHAAVRAYIVDFAAKRMYDVLVDWSRPQLAFDGPAAFVSELLERHGRVAPGDCSPEALSRTGQGDFHHPAPPLMCLVAMSPHIRTTTRGRGSGKRSSN